MPRHLNFLLLNIFLCYVASSSLPEPFTPTSNTTHLSATQPSCTGFKIFQLRPLYRDCDRAVSALSSSRLPGYFHSGSTMDDWQLPVTETAGSCEILVQLAPLSLPEASSWKEVKAAAAKLSDVCRVKSPLGDVTGGEIAAGPHDRIQISMVRRTGGLEVVAGG